MARTRIDDVDRIPPIRVVRRRRRILVLVAVAVWVLVLVMPMGVTQ